MDSKPIVLIILDGWGIAAPTIGNAVTSAKLPYWDYLLSNYPVISIQASGPAVGLPIGKMGNSEVGHLTIGSGQIFFQSLEKINKQIFSRKFFENQAFLKAINHVKKNNSNLHLIGLLGYGGVHAHQYHLYALLELIAGNDLKNNTFLHLFLDGRDTAKDQSLQFIKELLEEMKHLGCGKIASLSGRYYGMDRNKNWDRIKLSYDAMTGKSSSTIEDAILAIKDSYSRNIFDEDFKPATLTKNHQPVSKIFDNDAVIFFNFRSDRARQLTEAFVLDEFNEFNRGRKINNLFFVAFSEYEKNLPIEVAFPKPKIKNSLAKIISDNNLKQLHIAETEKYAHITFFINGLKEKAFMNEKRILIPSPSVTSYDQNPEMSVFKIKDKVLESLEQNDFNFIVINFANPDMVGHTGNLSASIKALESVDKCLSDIVESVSRRGGQVLITADHGNVEELINLETGQVDKEHTNFPVPCIIVKENYKKKFKPHKNLELHNLKIRGALVDVAPTILGMMELKKSDEMIGIDLNKII